MSFFIHNNETVTYKIMHCYKKNLFFSSHLLTMSILRACYVQLSLLSAPNPNSHVTVNRHLNVYKAFVLLDILHVILVLQR